MFPRSFWYLTNVPLSAKTPGRPPPRDLILTLSSLLHKDKPWEGQSTSHQHKDAGQTWNLSQNKLWQFASWLSDISMKYSTAQIERCKCKIVNRCAKSRTTGNSYLRGSICLSFCFRHYRHYLCHRHHHCRHHNNYLAWKRSSGWLESWEGRLFATDVSTTCAEGWHSEYGFHMGCRNVNRKQQSFSGLQSPRWSFSIKVCYSLDQTIFLITITAAIVIVNTITQFCQNRGRKANLCNTKIFWQL